MCDRCGEFPDFHHRRDLDRTAVEPPPPTPSLPETAGGRPRVLLIDDSAEHRDLYALMLEQTVTVITASGGEDGLSIATASPPDAVIVDVVMPRISGWEVCRRLGANPATASVPVIILTASDTADVPARALEAGAAAVLTKPCPPERLVLTIGAAIRRQRA
ncbi:MAG: two-component system response regulator [Betaproteobacteria bacterium]